MARVPRGQFARFIVVGCWNTAFSYCVYAFFTYILTGVIPYAYMAAMAVSSVINISVAYLGYKLFVFKTKGNYVREYFRCYVVYGAAAATNILLLPVLVILLDLVIVQQVYVPYIAGGALSLGTVFLSFFGHKEFSFKPQCGAATRATAPGEATESER